MNETMDGLSFSEEALANRALFLSGLNDINIFVEDDGKEYVYEEIFERLFEGRISIFSIFPLGGKDAVIRKHDTSDTYDSEGKLNVFIVDGDFDNLWDEEKTISPNLIYLDRYNIESYYCVKESVIKYMRSFLKRTREQVDALICYDAWLNSFRQEAGQLFVLFALVQHHCPTLPNVSLGTAKFLDANGQLIIDEYQQYRAQIIAQIGPLENLIEEIEEKVHCRFTGEEESKILSIICGKYQIESLCRHLTLCCGKNISREGIRNALISSFDLEPIGFVKDRIVQLIPAEVRSQISA